MQAQRPPPELAFSRAQRLQHGINTSIWFAQSPQNYSVERLRTFTTEQDLVLIRQLGFDHIRLSVDPVPLEGWKRNSPAGQAFMTELDRVVRAAMKTQLAVVLDLHPESAYKQELLHGDASVEAFASLWSAVAAHFADLDPDSLFFELMNEPEQTDRYRWQGMEALLAQRIRHVAPRQTLIATGAQWSGMEDLLRLEPVADRNVIYTFHDYEPFAFTHQGATWTSPEVAPLRGVPYPALPGDVQHNVDQESSLTGKYFVERYAMDHWDADRIERSVAFAEAWSQLHHVPVYCGEFGVHRPYADEASRVRWLQDMRTALERHHIGWAMWDYQTNFGLVTKENGTTTADPLVVRALGLQATK